MNNYLNSIIAMGLNFMNEINTSNEKWKKEILKGWELSKKYPRKKKKKTRKELLLKWSIANWNPFDY